MSMTQNDTLRLRQDLGKSVAGFYFAEADLLVKAKVSRKDIQMLAKLVEGLGHLGTVTTTNKAEGEVLIQTTKDCWPELRQAILSMPFVVVLMD
ncbi:DUF4911 domain-containing protein [Paradesulfitobacterium ferrireducens]|uniref:DUF4911 domain-containing protein n=1 Tax=Paradesulfitobacterium ferrireducens TaxID=2816476 RepID=UPI001F199239|nr:DUF4911 domain-containing protein [Paradesulfitobacterium ferrireducens]